MPSSNNSPPPIDAVAATASLRTLGTAGTQAAAGNDSRLSTPTNATATPTASKIPIADGSGKLDSGWLPTTIVSAASSTPSIVIATASLPASVNLSTEGTIDWFDIMNNVTNPPPYSSSPHRKVRGEDDIANSFLWFGTSSTTTITAFDSTFPRSTTSGDDTNYSSQLSSYTNAVFIAPTGTQTGHGFRFRVKATRAQRVLRMYCGRNAATITVTGTLTDGTTSNLAIAAAGGSPTVLQLGQKVTITFNAGTEGQWLTVDVKCTTMNSNAGNTFFAAATLAPS